MQLTIEMINCETWKEPLSTVFTQLQSKIPCCEERLVVSAWSTIVRWQLGPKLGISDKNRDKARLKVAKIHAAIRDSRKDFLHKLTTRLVRENQTIVAESLAVNNMVKNPKLAFAISDAGWGELTRQLAYKALWYGRDFVQLDRWFPGSKTCSKCSHIVEKLPLSVREWDCPKCNAHHDRDENAAKNHLAAGLAVLVCVMSSTTSTTLTQI